MGIFGNRCAGATPERDIFPIDLRTERILLDVQIAHKDIFKDDEDKS